MTDPTSVIEVFCDTCGKAFRVKSKAAGRRVNCPACKNPTIVPKAAEMQEALTQQATPESFDYDFNAPPPEPPKPPELPSIRTNRAAEKRPQESSLSAPVAAFLTSPPDDHFSIVIMIWCLRILALLCIAAWLFPILIYLIMTLMIGSGSESGEIAEQRVNALSAVAFLFGLLPFFAYTVTIFFVALVCLTAAELLGVAVRLDRNTYHVALVSTPKNYDEHQQVPEFGRA